MVVGILEDAKSQCSRIRDVYAVIQPEESVGTRGPTGLVVQWDSASSDKCSRAVRSDCRLETMSAWSRSVSMISEPCRAGSQKVVAQRDKASCSSVNMGRRFCGLILA